MEGNRQINPAGNVEDDKAIFDDLNFEKNNNTGITPSLSEFELRQIKEELGMLDNGGEFSLPLPSICVDGEADCETQFDLPLSEEERALLERCTIGSPRRFSNSPSLCSTSLDELADNLIKDLEGMDSEDEAFFEREMFEGKSPEITSAGKEEDFNTSPLTNDVQNWASFQQAEVDDPIIGASQLSEDECKNDKKISVDDTFEIANKQSVSTRVNLNTAPGSSTASTSSLSAQLSDDRSRSPSFDSDSLPASIEPGPPISHIPQHNFFVVVAIDFGTTYSGYAFAFTRDPDSVHMMRRWEGGDPGVTNQKTPTTLLLKPDGSFHSFGFGARDFYHDLEPEDAKKWMYFEKFKMNLHSEKNLHKDVEIKAANGKSVRAVTIFAHALTFFKDHVLEELSDQSATRIMEEDIQWVLTVPAIWKAPAKQFMRTAAYEAGLTSLHSPDRLLIALEPEAASIYCRKLRLRDCIWAEETKRRSNTPLKMDSLVRDEFQENTRYLVVDCGGGTVDLTVHELDSQTGTLEELHRGTGGACGATGVDEQFELLLKKIFGKDFIGQFKKKRPAGWVDLMIAFEAKKRTASRNKTSPLNISLPYSFIDYHKKHKGSSIESAVKKFGDANVKWSSQGMLRIAPGTMKQLFDPVLNRIIEHIENLTGREKLKDLHFLFLVGGFAESPLLQSAIREVFDSKMKVIIPQEVGLTILRGAVLFGMDPTVVRVRRAAMTYGVGVLNRFIVGTHPRNKLVKKSGVDWCTDVFDKFVTCDQPVKLGESVTRRYASTKPGKASTVITIYSTEAENVNFVTDDGVKKCGQLVLEIPQIDDCDPNKPRELKASMIFGDTEIRVTAVDSLSGNEAKASINFLSG